MGLKDSPLETIVLTSRKKQQYASLTKITTKSEKLSYTDKRDINLCYVKAVLQVVENKNGKAAVDHILEEYSSFLDPEVHTFETVKKHITHGVAFFRHIDALSYHIIYNLALKEAEITTEEERRDFGYLVGRYGMKNNPIVGLIQRLPLDVLVNQFSKNNEWLNTVVDIQPMLIQEREEREERKEREEKKERNDRKKKGMREIIGEKIARPHYLKLLQEHFTREDVEKSLENDLYVTEGALQEAFRVKGIKVKMTRLEKLPDAKQYLNKSYLEDEKYASPAYSQNSEQLSIPPYYIFSLKYPLGPGKKYLGKLVQDIKEWIRVRNPFLTPKLLMEADKENQTLRDESEHTADELREQREDVEKEKRILRALLEQENAPAVVDYLLNPTTPITQIGPATIVFLDLSGFTADSKQRTLEELAEKLSGFYPTVKRIAERMQASTMKLAGDGIMLNFGLPFTYRNRGDVLRAAYAAIQLRDFAQSYGWLSVRGGINTGEVLGMKIRTEEVSETNRPLFLRYDFFGDTVNIASRVEGKAEKNSIFITESVAEALRSYAIINPKGFVQMKGVNEPLSVYELKELKKLWEYNERIAEHEKRAAEQILKEKIIPLEEKLAEEITGNKNWFLEQGIREGRLYFQQEVAFYAWQIGQALLVQGEFVDLDRLIAIPYLEEIGKTKIPLRYQTFEEESANSTTTRHIFEFKTQVMRTTDAFLEEMGKEKELQIIQELRKETPEAIESAIIYLAKEYVATQHDQKLNREEKETWFLAQTGEFREKYPLVYEAFLKRRNLR